MTKTVLITGGTGGIGESAVRLFAENGYNTAFTYNTNAAKAKELIGPGVFAVRCDVSDADSVNAAFRAVVERFGRVDVLINNAGISRQKLFTDITDDDWDEILGVNLKGCFLMCRAAAPQMIARKDGVIINVSSMWGVSGASCEVHYSAAKSGVIGLSRALAKELGPSGIRVNAVAPGLIDTPMNAHLSPRDIDALVEEIPLGRMGTPTDVARALLFLAGDGGRYITGQVIGVDGGFLI